MIDCDGCTLHVAYVVVKSDIGTHSGNTRGWKLCVAALLVHIRRPMSLDGVVHVAVGGCCAASLLS